MGCWFSCIWFPLVGICNVCKDKSAAIADALLDGYGNPIDIPDFKAMNGSQILTFITNLTNGSVKLEISHDAIKILDPTLNSMTDFKPIQLEITGDNIKILDDPSGSAAVQRRGLPDVDTTANPNLKVAGPLGTHGSSCVYGLLAFLVLGLFAFSVFKLFSAKRARNLKNRGVLHQARYADIDNASEKVDYAATPEIVCTNPHCPHGFAAQLPLPRRPLASSDLLSRC